MKNLYITIAVLLGCLIFKRADAQDIYIKATLMGSSATLITKDASPSAPDKVADGNKTLDLRDYMNVSSLSYDTEQTLNIGSQSTGAGAGRIMFNPLVITKIVDVTSTKLFMAQASGTPMNLEIVFVAANSTGKQSVVYKLILGLAAVKNYGASSTGDCSSCPLEETISFEYGSLSIYTYSTDAKGTVVVNPPAGWNRVTNTAINP